MRALVLAVVAAGCAHGGGSEAGCRMARLERANLYRLSARQLAEVARGTPAAGLAASGHSQQLAARVLTGAGMGAIAVGLVQGLVVSPATNEGARTGAYVLGGSAFGILTTASVLAITSSGTLAEARSELAEWADRCGRLAAGP